MTCIRHSYIPQAQFFSFICPYPQFYEETDVLLPQLLQLLFGFMDRTHQSLAAVGVAALVRLVNSAAPHMDTAAWMLVTNFLMSTSQVGHVTDASHHHAVVLASAGITSIPSRTTAPASTACAAHPKTLSNSLRDTCLLALPPPPTHRRYAHQLLSW
jgi:hypothetical protein